MFIKKILFGLGLLLIFTPTLGGFPATTYAQQDNPPKPNFVFVNYFGQDLILDLDDVTYTVPGTAVATAGGRLELRLNEGEHKYAANVPGVNTGSAGTFVINGGGYIGKAARMEKTNALLDRSGNVLEEPKDMVFVFDVDPFAAPVVSTPVVDTWQPAVAAPGQGSIAWTNYNGDELTIDLNGAIYKVPAAANNISGHLQFNVAPGLYRYTASVPYGSLNGEVNIAVGQVIGLNLSAKPQEEVEYKTGEPAPGPQPVELQLAQENLTARAVSAATPAAPVTSGQVSASGGTATSANANETGMTATGLLIKNFAGETLLFTINDQTYPIANNTEISLPLAPGRYNYTVSLPLVATTGTVDLAPGQGVELSIAINVNHDALSVYQK